MWKTLLRPAMIFIPFALGMLFPQAHILGGSPYHMIQISIIIMVLLSCLQIRLADLRVRKEHGEILLVNLLMGVVPYGIVRVLLPEETALQYAAFFVGITPTATAALVVISFFHGRIGFALTGFTVSNVFISLALILLLPVITGKMSWDFVRQVASTIGQIILLPFVLSLILQKIDPKIRELPKKYKTFSFSLWSFMLFILAATARQYFLDHPDEPVSRVAAIAGISLVICIANFAVGRMMARKKFCRETSQLLGQKNTSFTMYLALQYASPLAAMGPIFYILWHNTYNAFQMYRYDRRRVQRSRSR